MKSRFHFLLSAILLLFLLSLTTRSLAFEALLGFKDMFRVKQLQSPRLSPDGKMMVVAVQEADTTADEWISNLWLVALENGTAKQITRGHKSAHHARWYPEGKYIAFLKKEEKFNNIYLVSPQGEAPHRLFSFAADIKDFRFHPDGRSVYFLAPDTGLAKTEEQKEPYFVDENYHQVHLWIYRLESKRLEKLTDNDFSVWEFSISPDGQQIAFTAAPTPLMNDYPNIELYLFNIAQNTVQQLTQNHITERSVTWSPDGRYLSFLSAANSQLQPYYQDSIFLLNLATHGISDLLPDFRYQVLDFFWTRRGKYIYFIANTGVNTQFFRLNRNAGGVKQLTHDTQDIKHLHYLPARDWLVYLQSTPVRPFEVFGGKLKRLPGTQLTHLNQWLDQFIKARYETVHWVSSDGYRAEGILLLPAMPNKTPYPLVVQLHGGPASSFRNRFAFSWTTYAQVWSSQGYAVFQPNYRGSTGYGDEVMRAIIGHYFEKDIDDIITGVDYLINQNLADPEHLAVMGWSAGGHLTNWLVTHTQRFKAACSGAGGANWFSFYAQTDVRFIREIWHLGPPYTRNEYYMRKSPVSYVKQAKTPTLILCGENDRRVPFPQSLEMYRGLQRFGCETRLVAFPKEGHGLKKISHQLYKMRIEFNWIEEHLFDRSWKLEELE